MDRQGNQERGAVKTVVTAGAFDTRGADYGFLVSRIRSHELELLTRPWAFDENQSREMARAGADLLAAHAGLTTKGSIGARNAMTLEEAAAFVQRIVEAGRNERGDLLVLCHGGRNAEPEDVAWVIEHTSSLDGFFGASCNDSSQPTEPSLSRHAASNRFVTRRNRSPQGIGMVEGELT